MTKVRMTGGNYQLRVVLNHEVRYTKFMNRTEIRLALLIASLAVYCRADTPVNENSAADNPYKTIVERNPFGLKPPPPPAPAPQPATDQAKTDLKLTGITSFGSVKAYFSATDSKSKTPEYFSLGVDEKKDGIEVLAIDDAAKSVRIRSAGVETLMTFATHGVAAPTTPPPAAPAPGVPGASPMTGRVANTMPVTPGTAPGTPANAGIYTLPSRTPRVQMDPNMAARYGLSGAPSSNVSPQPAPRNTMSSEEQAILMEVQRIANPSLPPTPGVPSFDNAPGIPAPVVPAPGFPRSPRLPGQF